MSVSVSVCIGSGTVLLRLGGGGGEGGFRVSGDGLRGRRASVVLLAVTRGSGSRRCRDSGRLW